MNYVFEPSMPVAVPVAGDDRQFAVRRVYCVGRNYAAHAREMGSDPDREPPFFFCKPGDAIVPVREGETLSLKYPPQTSDFHYEIELVAAIGKGGFNISRDEALEHIFGYAVGLDMTRRDLQSEMKKGGRPWEIGKAFDQSAPIGPLHTVDKVGHPEDAAIWLQVNGTDKQRSSTKELIWSVAETVAYLSQFFRLEPGDLIYTGTPEGVGPVVVGDLMQGGVDGLGTIQVRVE